MPEPEPESGAPGPEPEPGAPEPEPEPEPGALEPEPEPEPGAPEPEPEPEPVPEPEPEPEPEPRAPEPEPEPGAPEPEPEPETGAPEPEPEPGVPEPVPEPEPPDPPVLVLVGDTELVVREVAADEVTPPVVEGPVRLMAELVVDVINVDEAGATKLNTNSPKFKLSPLGPVNETSNEAPATALTKTILMG